MRNSPCQKNWPPGIFVSLFLVSAIAFLLGVTTASAKPRPLSPPWPSFGLLQREGFDQPYSFATNQTIDSTVWVEGWSGWALNRQGTTVTPWTVPMVVSNSFRVEPERGAIRFWYRPDFSSGVGPGQPATLLALTAINGQTELNWWSLVVTPDGNEVHLVCQTENGSQSCLQTEISWAAGSWHLVTLGFTPTNSALFIDDQLAAVGPGLETVPKEIAPYTTLVVGSTAAGTLPAQGQIEELWVFSGRKRMPQVMGNNFGLSVDWEIGTYYATHSKTAALGPISDEEIAMRAALSAQRRAEREALGLEGEGGGMEMMISGPAAECVTNSPLYITNTVAWFDTNTLWTIQFEIQGTNSPADIFVTTNLVGNYLTNSFWVWLERGPTCYTYQYTNQSSERSFYILGDATVDSDGDGLPDAYEKLVTHTDPQVWNYLDTDGDGLADAWELAHGYDPGRADTNGNGIPDGYEDWDGDTLANLMEAGFRSDPAVANATWKQDSDADGIPDSVDDSPSLTDPPPLVTTFDKCPLP